MARPDGTIAIEGEPMQAPLRSMYHERPDYRVDLLPRTNQMTAWLGDARLARSGACLLVDEQDHGLVVYFPPDAVDFSLLAPIGERTVCPFKGQAVYWRAAGTDGPGSGGDGSDGHGIAWSYPEPFPEVARLAGYVAFDQDAVRVTIGKGRYTGIRP
jgi:uncharacterized protein (DUF427 family)